MSSEQYLIKSLRDCPEFYGAASKWLSANWCTRHLEHEKVLAACLNSTASLPQWYLALDQNKVIRGGCGMVRSERADLSPLVCSLIVEESERERLESELLKHSKTEAGRLGYDVVFLGTYQKSAPAQFGWRFVTDYHDNSHQPVKIYAAPTEKVVRLERMDDFFAARLDLYEDHMLENDGRNLYRQFAELVPAEAATILDLGCGTGLELDEIFKLHPDVSVLGIDLTQTMLDRLKSKHPLKNLCLICGNYFDYDFSENRFDTVLSFQTLHHFSHLQKVNLYQKIHQALNTGGVYLEADYIVIEQAVEEILDAENRRRRQEQNIPEGVFYHFDTPCTVDNQIRLLRQAGFTSVEMEYQRAFITFISARR